MRMRWVLPVAVMLSSCAVLDGNQSAPVVPVESNEDVKILEENTPLCLVEENEASFNHQCDLLYWVNFWVQAEDTAWPNRKAAISALGKSPEDKIKKIILSLPIDTPYQDRLRGQHWLKELEQVMSPKIKDVINTVVLAPNGEMLELESAMVVLNRAKNVREDEAETLQLELKSLRKKMDELLQIEATLMDKNRSSQP